MEQQDIQYKGMTSQPSDYLCEDGTTHIAVNMEVRDGSLHAARVPVEEWFHKDEFEPRFLHVTSDGKRIMIGIVKYYEAEPSTNSEETQYIWNGKYTISAVDITDNGTNLSRMDIKNYPIAYGKDAFKEFKCIGNLLVVLIDSVPVFFRYRNTFYSRIASDFNLIDLSIRCIRKQENTNDNMSELWPNKQVIANRSDGSMTKYYLPYISRAYSRNASKARSDIRATSDYIKYEDAVLAAVNTVHFDLLSTGNFLFPVVLRYAYRLYDGSHVSPSQPILIFPLRSTIVDDANDEYKKDHYPNFNSIDKRIDVKYRSFRYEAYRIMIRIKKDVVDNISNELSDVVTAVDFFLSEELYTIDTSSLNTNLFIPSSYSSGGWAGDKWKDKDNEPIPGYLARGYKIYANPCFTYKNLYEQLENVSNFYLVRSMDFDEIKGKDSEYFNLFDGEIPQYTQNERLEESGTSISDMKANGMYTYNNRLILFDTFKRYANPEIHNYLYPTIRNWDGAQNIPNALRDEYLYPHVLGMYVSMEIDGSTLDVGIEADENDELRLPILTCYKTTNKAKLVIKSVGKDYFVAPMKSGLIPSWSFYVNVQQKGELTYDGIKDEHNTPDKKYNSDVVLSKETRYFRFANQVKSSDVNNPFSYTDGNSVRCGSSHVLSLTTSASEVSQGQFGQFPLFAFCGDGVFAIGIGADGTLQNSAPYSTDILANGISVGNVGRNIVFASKSGIMSIGEEGRKLLLPADKFATYAYDNARQGEIMEGIADKYSLVLPGMASLYDYITNGARIAYDYQNRRIIVYSPNYGYSYVMDEDTQSWTVITKKFTGHLNPVAQCLMVGDDGETVYDYSSDKVETQQAAWLSTRAIKLGAPDSLKTVRAVMQRGRFANRGSVMQLLYGSRDLVNWYPIRSSITSVMRGFGGTGYKYFRIFAFMPQMKQDESLSGCSVGFDLRMTGRMR